ncbi:MAG: helix-hairpin-helix domain-containing protein [Pirellulales bacterium]
MKWTWDYFGYYTSELNTNPAPILKSLDLSEDLATVHFFPETGLAVVGCDLPGNVGPDKIDSAKRLSCWDLMVCDAKQLQEMQNNGRRQLARLGLETKVVEVLVANGIFTLDVISALEPDRLARLIGVSQPGADKIIESADFLCWEDSNDVNREDEERKS